MTRFEDYPKRTRTAIVIGGVLVACGCLGMVDEYAKVDWWRALVDAVSDVSGYIMPVALIALGIYVLWAVKHDKLDGILHGTREGSLSRSRTDKRFAGVCGGIAQYFGIDSIIVRIVALLLFIAAPLFALIAYVLLAAVLPQS